MQSPNYYKNINLVCAPQLSGRNFLINALSLSDRAVFRDSKLARAQLDGNFGYHDKLQHLSQLCELAKNKKSWDVGGPVCSRLYGFKGYEYVSEFHEVLQFKFDSIVDKLIDQNKTLFLIVHKLPHLPYYLQFWPNANLIFFTNFERFDQYRRTNKPVNPKLIEYWNAVRGPDWPSYPPTTLTEFYFLPKIIQHELEISFDFEIQRWFKRTEQQYELFNEYVVKFSEQYKNNNQYVWDVEENYYDKDKFLTNFKNLSDLIELPCVNIDDIEEYYVNWQQTTKLILNSDNNE